MMSKRLGKLQWIDAGLKALAAGGVEAVRVEKIAQALQITKGSFYWHFKDRGALLEALLHAWKTRATDDVIAEVEKPGGDARTRLRSLFSITFKSDGRLDRAVREWAGKDPLALAAQDHIDRRRVGYVAALFEELGFAPMEAKARARFVYHALIGRFTLAARARQQQANEEFEAIFAMLTRSG
jgi:AcrR family transcriptional regulator